MCKDSAQIKMFLACIFKRSLIPPDSVAILPVFANTHFSTVLLPSCYHCPSGILVASFRNWWVSQGDCLCYDFTSAKRDGLITVFFTYQKKSSFGWTCLSSCGELFTAPNHISCSLRIMNGPLKSLQPLITRRQLKLEHCCCCFLSLSFLKE